MYAIVYDNKVILTQPKWNPRMFNSIIEEEVGSSPNLVLADELKVPIIKEVQKTLQTQTGTQDVEIPVTTQVQQEVLDPNTGLPVLDENGNIVYETVTKTEIVITQQPVYETTTAIIYLKILPYADIIPDHNRKIEWVDGPIYDINENSVIGNYVVKPLDLEVAKGRLKDLVPAARYARETKPIQINLQNQIITLKTDRETRAIYVNKFASMVDESINWKFPEGWLNLSKSDFEYILQQIDLSVQEAFDWEYSKYFEINACKSLEDIDKVKI